MTLYISEAVAVVNSTDGDFKPATTAMPVYTAFTGGTQVTDLTDSVGNPLANNQVTPVAPSYQCIFQSAQTGTLFIQTPDGVRHPVQPSDLASRTGGVSSVNTKTGAVTLTADDINDGTTKVEMLATERAKLNGVATNATANSTDAQLRDRATHTGTDAAPSGSVDGQIMGISGGLVVPVTLPGPATPVYALDDATDLDESARVAGSPILWDGTKYVADARSRGNAFYSAGEAILPGQVPALIWDKAAVSVLRTHTIEGTAGTAATSGTGLTSTNYSSWQGANQNFSSGGVVGSTCVIVPAGSKGYYVDSGLAQDVLVFKRWIKFIAPTGIMNFARCGTSAATSNGIAVLQRDTTGAIKMKNGTGATMQTTPYTVPSDVWVAYQWKVDGAGGTQELRFYDQTGAPLGDPQAGVPCTVGQIDNTWNGIDSNFNGGFGIDDAFAALDFLPVP